MASRRRVAGLAGLAGLAPSSSRPLARLLIHASDALAALPHTPDTETAACFVRFSRLVRIPG
jgi:hypothetical protein